MTATTRAQRVVLIIVALLLILAELPRLPRLLDSFQGDDTAADAGRVVSLLLSVLFAVQIFRGRWLLAALWFLALFIAVEVWATFRMPVTIGDVPFRYPVFLARLPFMLVHILSFTGIFYVRYAPTSKTLNA